MRQMQVGGGKAMSFGKSRAKLLTVASRDVCDAAGVDEAKDDLQEISHSKRSKNLPSWAAEYPKAVLLAGLGAGGLYWPAPEKPECLS